MKTLSREKKMEIWKQRDDAKKRSVNSVVAIANSAIKREFNLVNQFIEENRTSADDFIGIAGSQLTKKIPQFENVGRKLTRFAITQFNSLSNAPDVVFNDGYRKIADNHTLRNLSTMNATSRIRFEQMFNELNTAKNEEEIAFLMRKYLRDNINRADTYAWTTITQISGNVDYAIANQEDFIIGKQWFTQGDDRVREQHKLQDGEIVKPDENFTIVKLPFPSQYRCRCGINQVFADDVDLVEDEEGNIL